MLLKGHSLYRFDDFELETSRRVLTRGGERIAIAPKTFEVLLCLVQSPGKVLLKDELMREVWPDAFVEESNLSQQVFWLRKALGDKAGYVVTVPGRGYEFTGVVEEVVEPAPVGVTVRAQETVELTRVVIEETVFEAPERRSRGWVWGWVWGLGAGVALMAAVGWGGWKWEHRVVPGDHHEVMVADFENTTGDGGFDLALKTLLRIDLNQSPYLVVADESDTRKVLGLMDRNQEEAITGAVALEVCQRLNGQVVLSGMVAKFGGKYLVTLAAKDCGSGKLLLETKATAEGREAVLGAVDKLAADMRTRLGEAMPARGSGGVPLQMVHTFSLEALRVYSQGVKLKEAGREAEAIPLLKQAIGLDERFAAAYLELADCYFNLHEHDSGLDPLKKAYALRNEVDEELRLSIVALYNDVVLQDIRAQYANLVTWTQTYPNRAQPWLDLAAIQADLGEFDAALVSARRATVAAPDRVENYPRLAEALMQTGHLEEANAVCAEAQRRGLDSATVHGVLMEIAWMRHDSAAWETEMAWLRSQGEERGRMVYILLAEGKAHASVKLWLEMIEDDRRQGFDQLADKEARLLLRREADYEMLPEMRAQMVGMDLRKYPQRLITANAVLGRVRDARIGLEAYAAQITNKDITASECYYPQALAAIALAEHKPEEAIAAMERARGWDLGSIEGPLLRGKAYLAAGKPDEALREFKILHDHPFLAPIFPFHALAHLGSARALAMKGDVAGSRREYETVFAMWKDADEDLPPLVQARAEYARLQG